MVGVKSRPKAAFNLGLLKISMTSFNRLNFLDKTTFRFREVIQLNRFANSQFKTKPMKITYIYKGKITTIDV